MSRSCDVCGTQYEAKRSSSRYCSARCRNRKARGHTLLAAPLTSLPASEGSEGSTVAQVRAELASADRVDTYLGAAALALADRIDNATAVMGFAQLVRELRVTMTAAMEGAKHDVDALTDIRSAAALKLIRSA